MTEKRIVDTSYSQIIKPTEYTIIEIANKLNVSTTKINHLIFKLNKANEGFFKNTAKLTQEDFEKIELAQELLNDGLTYDDVVNYFKDESHSLINREDNTISEDLTEMDVQVIAKSITLEVKRQTDRVIESIQNEIALGLADSFKNEATKIAQISLEAMKQTKNEMINEVKDLKNQNDLMRSELERMHSKQTDELRKKLESKEKKLLEMKERENDKWWKKIFR